WRRARNQHEVDALAAVLDSIVIGDLDEAVEILVCRLTGVHEVDQGRSWSVCEALQRHTSNGSLLPRAKLRSAMKEASIADKIKVKQTTIAGSKKGKSSWYGGGGGKSGFGGGKGGGSGVGGVVSGGGRNGS